MGIAVNFFLMVISLGLTEGILVKTPLGPVRGLQVTDQNSGQTVYEFRGIKFAKAPTGERRFKKPEAVDPWTEEYDATKYGPACPQQLNDFLKDGSEIQSEDCLFLNVYVPRTLKPGVKHSVMVWIHGGGFVFGNGHSYRGTRISAVGDVIMVTINYRLGVFGFLTLFHSAARGNYGLWDQAMALEWVHDNIASFGGNPGSVSIFGESAGGMSVSFHAVRAANKGLFQRVIAQSGALSKLEIVKRKASAKIISQLEKTNCSSADMFTFVDCLRKVSIDDLLQATDYFAGIAKDKLSMDNIYGVSFDNDFFREHPLSVLRKPESEEATFFKSLDYMTGVCSQEGSGVYMVMTPELHELYKFNVTEGIPANVLCDAIIKPYVDWHYEGDEHILNTMCEFYTASEGSMDDQSNRAADFLADTIFNVAAAELLDFHSSLGGGKTYQYQFSKTSPKLFMDPPAWFKGTGHGEDLPFLFFDEFAEKGGIHDTMWGGVTLSDSDKFAIDRLTALYTTFAKYG